MHIFLFNPVSGRGHLDAYARLYARALLELGHQVTLVAEGEGGVGDYLARNTEGIADRFAFVSFASAEAALDPGGQASLERRSLPAHRRAALVWREEGINGLLRRCLTVFKRTVMRAAPPVLLERLKRLRTPAILKLYRWINPDFGRFSFVSMARYVGGTTRVVNANPDLVINLYLDIMGEGRRSIATFDGSCRLPWTGILFHPRCDGAGEAKTEKYFASRKARGAIFLVPARVPAYETARRDLYFALVPDVADIELADFPHAVAKQIAERAKGRAVVLQIGTIAPHKGIASLLDVIAKSDARRFFFALVGEVHWESFGAEQESLRKFYASPPDNVLIYQGYVAEERDYNSVIRASDIIYAVYDGFDSSSNSLTKAAGLQRKILVAEGTLMGKRVRDARIGAVAPSGDPDRISEALAKLSEKPLHECGFTSYADAHSLGALKRVLASALPRWCAQDRPT